MRGQRSLFDEYIDAPQEVKASALGRDRECIAQRDRCLCYRYYYYVSISKQHVGYEAIVSQLAREFFLSTARTVAVLQEQQPQLRELKATAPTARQLSAVFPFFRW
jgi:hypothetical protein